MSSKKTKTVPDMFYGSAEVKILVFAVMIDMMETRTI